MSLVTPSQYAYQCRPTRRRLRLWWLLAGLLLSMLPLPGAWALAEDDFPDVCVSDSANLVSNCQFSAGFSGWHTFLEDGSAPTASVESSWPACDSPRCPAVRLFAPNWFVGGIYQQVSGVTPGTFYWANVVWLVYDPAGAVEVADYDVVGRQIGIDPYGGTDPTSPRVVWGEEYWKSFTTCPYKICRQLQVQAMARSSTVTVFVRIEDTWKIRRDEFPFVPDYYFSAEERYWIDDVGMIPIGSTSMVTATVGAEGGSLISNEGDQSVRVDFPAGAVSDGTLVTYIYEQPLPTGDLTGIDRFFSLEASHDGTPVVSFSKPVTITVRYPPQMVIEAGSDALYWQDGDGWVTGGITTTGRSDEELISLADHFSLFAVLGRSAHVYLPLVVK